MLAAIPALAAGYHKFVKFCDDQLTERMNKKAETLDLMTPLLVPYQTRKPGWLDLQYLRADSRLLIVAGRYVSQCYFTTHVLLNLNLQRYDFGNTGVYVQLSC
jgi:hypothetical protein